MNDIPLDPYQHGFKVGKEAGYAAAIAVCINLLQLYNDRAKQYVAGAPEFYAWGYRGDGAEECADAIERLANDENGTL